MCCFNLGGNLQSSAFIQIDNLFGYDGYRFSANLLVNANCPIFLDGICCWSLRVLRVNIMGDMRLRFLTVCCCFLF